MVTTDLRFVGAGQGEPWLDKRKATVLRGSVAYESDVSGHVEPRPWTQARGGNGVIAVVCRSFTVASLRIVVAATGSGDEDARPPTSRDASEYRPRTADQRAVRPETGLDSVAAPPESGDVTR
jgi:hypothetical protein